MEKSEDKLKKNHEESYDESSSTDHSYWCVEYFQLNDQLSFITKNISEEFELDHRPYEANADGNGTQEGNHQSKGNFFDEGI